MRGEIFLPFCFFHVIFHSTLSMYIVEKPTYRPIFSLPDADVSLYSTNSSEVKLKWRLTPNEDEKYVQEWWVSYRSKSHVHAPATLESHHHYGSTTNNHFVAVNARELPHDTGHSGRSVIWVEFRENYMLVTVDGLKYPGVDYEFELNRTGGRNKRSEFAMSTKISARTKPVLPDPPKVGAGCFHVYENSAKERRRTVKIYWQANRDARTYVLDVYEEGKSKPVYGEVGRVERGWMMVRISWKRHQFQFKSINEAGHSSESSVVNVPAQEDLLPAPTNIAVWNRTESAVKLTWQRPEGVNVSNYTVFWVDTLDGIASQHVFDFVYVSAEQTSVVVRGHDYVGLGLSVNSEYSSSGLIIAHWV